jgi:hypothetical protein
MDLNSDSCHLILILLTLGINISSSIIENNSIVETDLPVDSITIIITSI